MVEHHNVERKWLNWIAIILKLDYVKSGLKKNAQSIVSFLTSLFSKYRGPFLFLLIEQLSPNQRER